MKTAFSIICPAVLLFCSAVALGEPSRVVDAQGKPIAGARLGFNTRTHISWDEPGEAIATAVTDSQGRFEYPAAVQNMKRFYVHAIADGFLARHWLAGIQAFIKRDGVRLPDTLQLHRGATVSGTILGEDGKPLAGAEIAVDYFFDNGPAHINGNRVKSDGEGRFTAVDVPPANIIVRYEGPYSEAQPRDPVSVQPAKICFANFKAGDGAVIDDVLLDLSTCRCVVEGTLVDHFDKGVAGGWITATLAAAKGRLDESIMVKTDEDGRFRFEGLPPVELQIGRFTPSPSRTVTPTPERTTTVKMTTYVTGEKPPADETNEPAWGEPRSDGIIAGVRLEPHQKKYSVGDIAVVQVLLKNPTDRVQTFSYSFSKEAKLHVVDIDDVKLAVFSYAAFSGIPLTQQYRMEPGTQTVVGVMKIGFFDPDDEANSPPAATFQLPCTEGQFLSIHCDLAANAMGARRKTEIVPPLATGRKRMAVKIEDK